MFEISYRDFLKILNSYRCDKFCVDKFKIRFWGDYWFCPFFESGNGFGRLGIILLAYIGNIKKVYYFYYPYNKNDRGKNYSYLEWLYPAKVDFLDLHSKFGLDFVFYNAKVRFSDSFCDLVYYVDFELPQRFSEFDKFSSLCIDKEVCFKGNYWRSCLGFFSFTLDDSSLDGFIDVLGFNRDMVSKCVGYYYEYYIGQVDFDSISVVFKSERAMESFLDFLFSSVESLFSGLLSSIKQVIGGK